MGEMISAFEREQLQKLLWQLGDNAETEYSVMTGEQAIALLAYISTLETIAEAAEAVLIAPAKDEPYRMMELEQALDKRKGE